MDHRGKWTDLIDSLISPCKTPSKQVRGGAVQPHAESGAAPSSSAPGSHADRNYNNNDPRSTAASGGFGPRRGPGHAYNPPRPPPAMRMQASTSDPGPLRERAGPAAEGAGPAAEGGEGLGEDAAASMRSQNPSPTGSTVSGVVVPRAALPGAAAAAPTRAAATGRMPRDARGRRVRIFG